MHILVCAVSYKTLSSYILQDYYMLITWTMDISQKGLINQFTALRLRILHAGTLEHSWGPQLVEDLFKISGEISRKQRFL